MSSDKFLRQIADYYVRRQDVCALEDLVFVLPNKRSAMFLKHYFTRSIKGVAFLPVFMTMTRLVGEVANTPVPDRKEQLFLLYQAYLCVMKRQENAMAPRSFDSFIFWGDIILNDFDEIDTSLADASMLFRNMRDVKQIQADYLDDDQKEIIRRIWGESRLTAAVDDFWMHLSADGQKAVEDKFVYLWQILGELYTEFRSLMEVNGLATPGMQMRKAVSELKNASDSRIFARGRYVFVGFSNPSVGETAVLRNFREHGSADFFWDVEAFVSESTVPEGNRAINRLLSLARSFPAPEDFDAGQIDNVPEIIHFSVPSNIGQAKQAAAVLKEWNDKGLVDTSDPLSTAVILPDEGLLLPMLYSIPESISPVNITMGLPYSSTVFATLIRTVISMQLRARFIHGHCHFYHEDVMELLAHPHVRFIGGDVCDEIQKYIVREHLFSVPASLFENRFTELEPLFHTVGNMESVGEVGDFMTGLIDWLIVRLRKSGSDSEVLLEQKMLDHYREEIVEIRRLAEKYGVEMSDSTFFTLFERMFDRALVSVNGKPLTGLQVMGVLESRSLDFDNVVILSMNENIFPRKQYVKTMIPNNLRLGYGLPPLDGSEADYALCFYRILARAKKVVLINDSRATNFGAGEVSRYLLQLQYLKPELKINECKADMCADISEGRVVSVPKTDDVMRELDGFRPGGCLSLSASALKTYKKCPLAFYLQYVRNMRGSEELTEYVSAADYGTMVHRVIELLYSRYENMNISVELIDSWLDENNGMLRSLIDSTVSAYTSRGRFNADGMVSAEGAVLGGVIDYVVRTMLGFERDAYCHPSFRFVKAEMKVVSPPAWQISPELCVNFKMSVDRVDEIEPGHLRFIDFKTGDDDTKAAGIDELFERGKNPKDAIFQLLTYCEAYAAMVDPAQDITPVVYPLKRLSSMSGIEPIVLGKEPLVSYRQCSAEFLPRLEALVKEIFDPDVPFGQASDAEDCAFCPFLNLCSRVVPKKF